MLLRPNFFFLNRRSIPVCHFQEHPRNLPNQKSYSHLHIEEPSNEPSSFSLTQIALAYNIGSPPTSATNSTQRPARRGNPPTYALHLSCLRQSPRSIRIRGRQVTPASPCIMHQGACILSVFKKGNTTSPLAYHEAVRLLRCTMYNQCRKRE